MHNCNCECTPCLEDNCSRCVCDPAHVLLVIVKDKKINFMDYFRVSNCYDPLSYFFLLKLYSY